MTALHEWFDGRLELAARRRHATTGVASSVTVVVATGMRSLGPVFWIIEGGVTGYEASYLADIRPRGPLLTWLACAGGMGYDALAISDREMQRAFAWFGIEIRDGRAALPDDEAALERFMNGPPRGAADATGEITVNERKPNPKTITVGRDVLVRLYLRAKQKTVERPAKVVHVHDNDTLDVSVFTRGRNDMLVNGGHEVTNYEDALNVIFVGGVAYDDRTEDFAEPSWHWPTIVPEKR